MEGKDENIFDTPVVLARMNSGENNHLSQVAVLLTCHNRRDKTLRCLKNLFAQNGTGINFRVDVFLVDDGSTDGTGEAVKESYPLVNVIKGNGSLFWNKGMHVAWQAASTHYDYDFYIWLNDDTFIFPNAIEMLLESYSVADSRAIICGATKSELTNDYTYGGKSENGDVIIPNGSLQPCKLLNGNFVLVGKNIFKEIGMIDEIFLHSVGDHDYGLRATKKGFKVLVAPHCIGYCERHERLPKWCSANVPLIQRMKALYSPLGNHPYYFFIYEKRHFGLLVAIKHFFSIHLRALLPSLWRQRIGQADLPHN